MAYSIDLRQKVLAACAAGHGTREVARRFGISERTVRGYKQRQREGRLAADKPGPRGPTRLTAGVSSNWSPASPISRCGNWLST